MIEQRTRKPKPTNYETRIQIRLSQQLYEDLKEYAGEKHMSKVVRRIIENYLYGNKKIIQKEELKRKNFMQQKVENEYNDLMEEINELKHESSPNLNGKVIYNEIQKQQEIEQRTKDKTFELFVD